MTKLLQSLKCAFWGAAIFVLIAGGLLLLSLRGQVQSVGSNLSQALKDTSAAAKSLKETSNQAKANVNLIGTQVMQAIANQERTVGKVLLHVDRATGEIAIAARQQRSYWETNAQKTEQILSSGNEAIKQLTQSEREITANFKEISESANAAIQRVGPAVDNIGRAATVATGTIEAIDIPAVNESLGSIRDTTANLSATSADVREAVHRLTRPASIWKQLAKGALGLASSVRTFF